MIRIIVLLSVFLFPQHEQKPTDSPVTSTPFHQAYQDNPLVADAAENHLLTEEMVKYLLKRRNPLDQKLAILNALSWGSTATGNLTILKDAITEKRKIAVLSPESRMKPHDQLLLGYMMLLENYFEPKLAAPYIEKGADRLPKSRTAQVIRAICRAQVSFDESWCQVWRHYEEVANREDLKNDFREKADRIIYDYLVLYKEDCGS